MVRGEKEPGLGEPGRGFQRWPHCFLASRCHILAFSLLFLLRIGRFPCPFHTVPQVVFVEALPLFRKKASYLKLARTRLTRGISVYPLCLEQI